MTFLFFSSIVLFVVLTDAAIVSSITAWPGFVDLPTCVQCALHVGAQVECYHLGSVEQDVFQQLKCATGVCVCNKYPEALSLVSSQVSFSQCSEADIVSATSVLSNYCRQLPSVTFNAFAVESGASTSNALPQPAGSPTTSSTTNTHISTIQPGITNSLYIR